MFSFFDNLLKLEANWNHKSDILFVSKYIENAAKELEIRNIKEMESIEQIKVFKTYLFNERRFSVNNKAKFVKNSLSSTVFNKGGLCLGMSTLYYTIAELLGLDFHPVLFEGHTAIVENSNTKLLKYIETLNGNIVDNRFMYLGMHYIGILKPEEFWAVHLSNTASQCYMYSSLIEEAIFLINFALTIYPDYTSGWINRGMMMKHNGNIAEMRRSLEKARSLNPGSLYSKAIAKVENEFVL